MPYETHVDLPSGVRRVLPEHALDVYRAAFNSAWSAGNGQIDDVHGLGFTITRWKGHWTKALVGNHPIRPIQRDTAAGPQLA